MFENQKELATKTFYAAVGAPVVMTRNVREAGEKYMDKLTTYGDRLQTNATTQLDDFAKEGQKVTKQLQGNTMVEELQSRVDLEKVQDRVEKLRDQLDGALQSWRESFTPEGKPAAEKVTVEGAVKTTPAKKAPAKTTVAKKAPAKKATVKASAKKAPAKKAPAKTTAAKKASVKATAKSS